MDEIYYRVEMGISPSDFNWDEDALFGEVYQPKLVFLEYHVIERTPCGVWIGQYKTKYKLIIHSHKKKWAYPTKEEALEAFKYRTLKWARYVKTAQETINLRCEAYKAYTGEVLEYK